MILPSLSSWSSALSSSSGSIFRSGACLAFVGTEEFNPRGLRLDGVWRMEGVGIGDKGSNVGDGLVNDGNDVVGDSDGLVVEEGGRCWILT